MIEMSSVSAKFCGRPFRLSFTHCIIDSSFLNLITSDILMTRITTDYFLSLMNGDDLNYMHDNICARVEQKLLF